MRTESEEREQLISAIKQQWAESGTAKRVDVQNALTLGVDLVELFGGEVLYDLAMGHVYKLPSDPGFVAAYEALHVAAEELDREAMADFEHNGVEGAQGQMARRRAVLEQISARVPEHQRRQLFASKVRLDGRAR